MNRLRISTHVVACVCALVLSSPVLAAEFTCPAGDVTCLIHKPRQNFRYVYGLVSRP